MAQKAKDKEEKLTKNVLKKEDKIPKKISSSLINDDSSILENILDSKETISSIKSAAKSKVKNTKNAIEKKTKTGKKLADKKIKDTVKVIEKKSKIVKKDIEKKVITAKKVADKKANTLKKDADKKIKTVKTKTKKDVASSKKSIDKELKNVKTTVKKSVKNTKKILDKEIKNVKEKLEPFILEYYDLPYKYNQTVVKVLAQNPNTLFVYWEISDDDRKNLEQEYGNRFFNITKPVLIITNLTDNYSYEIDINDFANNWYIHVNDTKCKYRVELGRVPIEISLEVPIDYVPITVSNVIESPNDHVLFYSDGDKIYFKNVRTNSVKERIYKSTTHSANLKEIYKNYNLSEDENNFDFKNPSSQNPTSNVM